MSGSAVAEPPTTRAEPGGGGIGTLQPPGILDNLFPPTAQETDSIWDKVTDPFGKQKEEKRKEQKKKIDELYGKGTASTIAAPLEDVKQVDILIQNDPSNNPFNGLASNLSLRKMQQQMNIKYSQMLQKHVCCPDSTAFKIAKLADGPARFLSGF
jgi:hypothetical protein